MAWTTPTTRAARELITAAKWNTDLVDNLNYLKTESDKGTRNVVLFRSGVETLVNATAAETTIGSGVIPAATLGADAFVKLEIGLYIFCDTGTSPFTFKIKYGGTTIITAIFSAGNSGEYLGSLVVFLRGDGATNAQEASAIITGAPTTSGTVIGIGKKGTAAEDSTLAKTLLVSVTHNNNSNLYTTKTFGVYCYSGVNY